jgi:hypothetical protein
MVMVHYRDKKAILNVLSIYRRRQLYQPEALVSVVNHNSKDLVLKLQKKTCFRRLEPQA